MKQVRIKSIVMWRVVVHTLQWMRSIHKKCLIYHLMINSSVIKFYRLKSPGTVDSLQCENRFIISIFLPNLPTKSLLFRLSAILFVYMCMHDLVLMMCSARALCWYPECSSSCQPLDMIWTWNWKDGFGDKRCGNLRLHYIGAATSRTLLVLHWGHWGIYVIFLSSRGRKGDKKTFQNIELSALAAIFDFHNIFHFLVLYSPWNDLILVYYYFIWLNSAVYKLLGHKVKKNLGFSIECYVLPSKIWNFLVIFTSLIFIRATLFLLLGAA